MKILAIDTTIHQSLIGGAQIFLPILIDGLVKKGHEVHLAVTDAPNLKIAKQIEDSRAILHTGLWRRNALPEEASAQFAIWVNDLKPDVYLVSVSPDIGWLALPYLRPEIATIAIGHTDSDTFYLPAAHYRSFLTGAIGVSKEICRHYNVDCQISPTNVNCIPYGVVVNSDPPVGKDNGRLQIVYVGRIEETQKRVSDLMKIIHELSAQNLDFHIRIIGDGPELEDLKKKLEGEIMMGRVSLDGWLSNKEIIATLRGSEIFLLTSAYEGFCISLAEAMANGCCPVVSDLVSGNRDMVSDTKNGFLIKTGDVNAFVEKIKWLFQNRHSLNNMRKEAWLTGQDFSIPKMVDSYELFLGKMKLAAAANERQTDSHFPVMESCRSVYPLWLRRLKVLVKRNKPELRS